jgi:hypothetical protein
MSASNLVTARIGDIGTTGTTADSSVTVDIAAVDAVGKHKI